MTTSAVVPRGACKRPLRHRFQVLLIFSPLCTTGMYLQESHIAYNAIDQALHVSVLPNPDEVT